MGLLYRVVINPLVLLNFTVLSRKSIDVGQNLCVNLMVGWSEFRY